MTVELAQMTVELAPDRSSGVRRLHFFEIKVDFQPVSAGMPRKKPTSG